MPSRGTRLGIAYAKCIKVFAKCLKHLQLADELIAVNSICKDEKYFIHNNLSFTVKYHRDELRDVSRIVAFEVKPYRYFELLMI